MATLALLADAASTANTLIDTFLWVYILLLFVYVLTSWVRLPYTVWVRRVTEFLRDVCEPYLRIFRRILPPFGRARPLAGRGHARVDRADAHRRRALRPLLLRRTS